ncbi:hypothetical protein MLD38_037780 [Melastoma candidum]|uniref:Uncharacterized protein n=1 Tax=Melastoma candidum TaxID=119954 RepID=A0ACB9LPN0_9MYRT|nr:hypothetical protein MLD38_037780 [Melastoma candidum]
MGFLLDDDPSCMVLTHVLYRAALAFAVLRWILCCAFRVKECLFADLSPVSSPLSSVSSEQIRQSLALTTYQEVSDRRHGVPDTCAVCLGQLSEDDEVRELRNCCHVFHRDCIDRWVDHDDDHHLHDQDDHGNRKSCPLCRTPLLKGSQVVAAHDLRWDEPSWAVERLLYLFGDDLLA